MNDEDGICDVDALHVRDLASARDLVAMTNARLAEGRRLRPDAEHIVDVVVPAAMPRELREALFPALAAGADSLTVRGAPSWHAESARLVPESPQSWDAIASAHGAQRSLTATVTGTTSDGLLVDVGRNAFLPGEQIDLRPVRKLASLVGTKLETRVIRYDMREATLIVSRRVILEERRDARKAETSTTLHEGASLPGRVATIVSYGVFIDLGGITAMLHAQDIPTLGERSPAEVFSIDEELMVSVARYRPEMGLVMLRLL